jgi:hypothetical protein
VLISACEPADTDPGPGGVTVGEARALDEAASMLDEQRLPSGALGEEPRTQSAEREASLEPDAPSR